MHWRGDDLGGEAGRGGEEHKAKLVVDRDGRWEVGADALEEDSQPRLVARDHILHRDVVGRGERRDEVEDCGSGAVQRRSVSHASAGRT